MTAQLSTPARTDMIVALLARFGASPILEIRTGLPPANPAAADTGTVLSTIALPADWMTAPAAGASQLKAALSDAADAAGYAGHVRIKSSDGVCHFQDLVSQPWAATSAFAVGQQVHKGGIVYRCTAAGNSGNAGPAGTGAGIADGGVTWSSVGGLGMDIDNTNLAVGQIFRLYGFGLTAPNA